MIDNCKFCEIMSNKEEVDKKIENTILFENNNFLVMPALGAITEGYLILIPQRHINSMAELCGEEMKDLFEILEMLKGILYDCYGIVPIVFEHGSGKQHTGASSSVVHAHIHIIPMNFCKQSHMNIITESKMNKIDAQNELYKYSDIPYILYIDENNNAFISKSTDVIMPSQYMRRKVATEKGIEDFWNWKEHDFYDNIVNTVKRIKENGLKTNR